jgi:hypothetical protein
MMKPKGKKHTRPPSFMRELDPHFDSRLPDNYFVVRDLPGKPLRFVKIDLGDDGVTNTVVLRFPEGSRPRKVVMWATKEVEIYDVFGQRLTPDSYYIETSRPRRSSSGKPKLVSIVPGLSDKITLNIGHIFWSFDAVVSIDTNTPKKRVNGETLSVLGVAVAKPTKLAYPPLVRITANKAIEFRNLKDPKEKYGWLIALQALYNTGWLDPRRKVGVIVDAYLNELSDFNAGGEIVPGYTLPENTKLIYASSDTAQFFGVNKCIKAADSFAALMVKEILRNKKLHPVADRKENAFYDAIRFWEMSQIEG